MPARPYPRNGHAVGDADVRTERSYVVQFDDGSRHEYTADAMALKFTIDDDVADARGKSGGLLSSGRALVSSLVRSGVTEIFHRTAPARADAEPTGPTPGVGSIPATERGVPPSRRAAAAADCTRL